MLIRYLQCGACEFVLWGHIIAVSSVYVSNKMECEHPGLLISLV